MANPNPVRRVENLLPNRGQGVPNAGAKPQSFRLRRDEVLAEIANLKPSECPDYDSIHQMAMEKLGALIAEGDGPTLRWYFDQMIGTARTTVTYAITNENVIKACGVVFSQYIPQDKVEEAVALLIKELGADR